MELKTQLKSKLQEIFKEVCGDKAKDPGLLTGLSGQILFSCFLNNDDNATGSYDLEKELDRLFDLSASTPLLSFCGGLAGVGWTLEFLDQRNFVKWDTNVLLEDFDDILSVFLEKELQGAHYDYLHGALGIMLYFIARVRKKKSLLPVLDNALLLLEKISHAQEDGAVKWISLLEREKNHYGYNISLSHGLASIISVLSKLYGVEGINRPKVAELIRNSVKYLMQQEISYEKYGSYFPSIAKESSKIINRSRLAWCYGDLGIASALWLAGNTLGEVSWKNKAVEILLYNAEHRRNLDANYVVDAGLCHGTAGIGHIFYRMWYNTRIPEFLETAGYWFEETLKMAHYPDGLAGYKTFHPQEIGGWQNDSGLLEGITGIGLALISYCEGIDPVWDECLLLS